MSKVELNGDDWKNLTRQIEEQTEKKCENCKHYRIENERGICESEGNFCILENNSFFEQKLIVIILPESVFKCKAREACEDNCKICEIESTDECKDRIPFKSEQIEFLCSKCDGNGFKICGDYFEKDEWGLSGSCSGCVNFGDCSENKCEVCKGKGSIKVEVLKKVWFSSEDGWDLTEWCTKKGFTNPLTNEDFKRKGKYVLLEVKLCE